MENKWNWRMRQKFQHGSQNSKVIIKILKINPIICFICPLQEIWMKFPFHIPQITVFYTFHKCFKVTTKIIKYLWIKTNEPHRPCDYLNCSMIYLKSINIQIFKIQYYLYISIKVVINWLKQKLKNKRIRFYWQNCFRSNEINPW